MRQEATLNQRDIGIDTLVEGKKDRLDRIRREQPELWSVIDGAYVAAGALMGAALKDAQMSPDVSAEASMAATYRMSMWQSASSYQAQSLFLIIDRCLDEGLALLRMSAEVARDIARLAENKSLMQVWLDRQKGRSQNRAYKKVFQFREADKTENHVYRLYNMSSGFGVHGHLTTAMSSRPTSSMHGGLYVVLSVPDEAVYEEINLWLHSFFPVQDMCARGFRITGGATTREAAALYDGFRMSFDDLLLKYNKNIKQMKADSKSKRH